MRDFEYVIDVETSTGITRLRGKRQLSEGAHHIAINLPEGKIKSCSGKMPLGMQKGERAFLNGYQTWTWCPEYKKTDAQRGLNGLPKPLIDKFGLDRYGDYHFTDYPMKPGLFHGESYGYLRDGEFYRLFASLNEEPGYTIFTYDANKGELTVTRDCAGVKCGGLYSVFDLFLASGSEDYVFDGWFRALGIKPLPAKPVKGYSSWYNRYEDISEKSIMDDLEGCAKVMEKGDLFQVDDGWEPNVGDWLEPDSAKFPGGMKNVVDAIHEKGFSAGLWLAPFVAKTGSKLWNEHQDWFLKVNGDNWSLGSNWGGFWSLDIDKPEVEAYIRETFRIVFDEWGFDLVKLDFLYGAAPFGNERESRAGRMIRAMKLLREVCGDHAILGCGVPVMPAFGLVEYCRVSCDVSLDWNDKPQMRIIHRERVSTKQAMENSIYRRQLNGRAYLSDPDVFFLRDDNIQLNETQKTVLATVNRLVGGVYLSSDNMGEYDEKKVKQYKALCNLKPIGKVIASTDDGIRLRYKTIEGPQVVDIYAK